MAAAAKSDRTRPDRATRAEERKEAGASHTADRPPTEEEEADAPGREDLDERTPAAYEDMAERGANDPGEGRVT